MDRPLFSLFYSPLDLAHHYWQLLLKPADTAVDATCGNGKDTLFLASLLPQGKVIGIDIQEKAIQKTAALLKNHLDRVELFCQSHVQFPPLVLEQKIKLFVYNLGYLPGGGNKELTTETAATLESVSQALNLLVPGGACSLTCYPGHTEGALEESALLSFAHNLNFSEWNVCYHKWLNRKRGPSLLWIQKCLSS